MSNVLTNILPKILATGLMTLREQAVMTRLVNVDYGTEAAQKGATIDVPLPVPGNPRDVTPSPTPSSATSTTPSLVQIQLDQWKHDDLFLTDKEMLEIDRNQHFMPQQVGEVVKGLANAVNNHVYAKYIEIYGWVGKSDDSTAVDPFASTAADAANARKVLNQQLAPMDQRRLVIDPNAEALALVLPQLSDFDKVPDIGPRVEGMMGRKMGLDWFMDQLVPTHTTGTASNITIASTVSASTSTIKLRVTGSGGTIKIGDVFTIAGDSQTYVSRTSATLASTTQTSITIRPQLQITASAADVVTKKASHKVNLVFQRNAFAFATRPLVSTVGSDLGSIIVSQTDPQTGLSLRLEVSRQYKQVAWDFDVLWGSACVRPELAARVAGAI